MVNARTVDVSRRWLVVACGLVLLAVSWWMAWRSWESYRQALILLSGDTWMELANITAVSMWWMLCCFGFAAVFTSLALPVYCFVAAQNAGSLYQAVVSRFTGRQVVSVDSEETGEEMDAEERRAFNAMADTVDSLTASLQQQLQVVGDLQTSLKAVSTKVTKVVEILRRQGGDLESLSERVTALEPEPVIPETPEQIAAREKQELLDLVSKLQSDLAAVKAASAATVAPVATAPAPVATAPASVAAPRPAVPQPAATAVSATPAG